MLPYPISPNEAERINELHNLDILDSPTEKNFDEIVKLAARTFDVSTSFISLMDTQRQWFKAHQGIGAGETERNIAMCNYTILQDEILEINDLREDERFVDNPLVTKEKFCFYAGAPLISSNGYKIGTLCIMDKSPRKLTNEQKTALLALSKHVMSIIELRMRNKELANMTEMQNKIISIIGHDIRNPMASFRVMLDLLDDKEKDFDEEEAAEMNELLRKQMDSTLDLLSNLVQWGKLHLHMSKGKPQKTDLQWLVDRTFRSVEFAARQKDNLLLNTVPAGTLLNIDEQVLEFILRNLLTNANKFTDNGSISVSIDSNANQYIIGVTDTGVGMDAVQIQQVLYEPGNHFTIGTRNEKGSGLGLSLVRAFLVKWKSSLSIVSNPGHGTTVSFTLNR